MQLIESSHSSLRSQGEKILSGPFAVTDVFNQNGRRYPADVYAQAYEELIPKIQDRRLLGELDHPIDRDEVFLSNVSHVVTECHLGRSKSGHMTYYGTVELLDTPAGKIAQALVKAGIPLGISSRGVGSTRNTQGGVDVTQLKLITYDLVAEPSFKTALLSETKKSELSESLSTIEARLPLNESTEYNSIRDKIQSIRESLQLTETEVNHISKESVQTMELRTLKSLVESKSKIIAADTKKLKEQRKLRNQDLARISKLEESLQLMNSRNTSLRENHQKLQEAFNALDSKHKDELAEKDAQILELQKRLAVEQRGMSYSQVNGLLEGVSHAADIGKRLDSLSKISHKSTVLSESNVESVKESLMSVPASKSTLSKVISRV